MAKDKAVDKTAWMLNVADKVFSQNGEDGIIAHIFEAIGVESKTFLEFGFGAPQCNCWRLMVEEEFGGTFIDADRLKVRQFIAYMKAKPSAMRDRIKAFQSKLAVENLDHVLYELASVPEEIDILSIDVDGNDFWLWKALERTRPRLVVIEYNPAPGKKRSVTIPYDADFEWQRDHSAFYRGASLGALERLGKAKGYRLIGCEGAGVNAFFLRDDIEAPFDTVTAEEAFRCVTPPLQGARWRQVSKLPWQEIE